MNSAYLASIIRDYGASEETMLKVRDIFMQGDVRYSDPENEAVVAGFMNNNAMSVSSTHHTNIPTAGKVSGPQKPLKLAAKNLLKPKGYKLSYEKAFAGNIADIIAKGKDTIIVECGPCNFRKAIDYLEKGATLWILRPEAIGYVLYEINRSENWETMIYFHNERMLSASKNAVDIAFNQKG